jgi:hypothetical protein
VGCSAGAALPPALGGADVFVFVITIYLLFWLRGICRVRRNGAVKPFRSGKLISWFWGII